MISIYSTTIRKTNPTKSKENGRTFFTMIEELNKRLEFYEGKMDYNYILYHQKTRGIVVRDICMEISKTVIQDDNGSPKYKKGQADQLKINCSSKI